MLVVDSMVNDSIILVPKQTPLSMVIDLMVKDLSVDNIIDGDEEESQFCPASRLSLHKHVFVIEEDFELVGKRTHLLGIFSSSDIPGIIHKQVDITVTPVGEVINYPSVRLEPNFEIETAFTLMLNKGLQILPIIGDSGEFLGALTIENLADKLYRKLQQTQSELEDKTAKFTLLEQVQEKNHELMETNQKLQKVICDRLATEAQLLQTTSELQEIFHAFPDTYFRIANNGEILSYHARESSDLYLPPEQFLNRKVQDILPADIAIKFQSAILQLNTGTSNIRIEYQLPISDNIQWFEARMLPSIQNQIIVIVRNITQQKQAESELKKSYEELESRVFERTQELKCTNDILLAEIIERRRIEEILSYRAEFTKIISGISTNFINLTLNQIDRGIEEALKTISEFLAIDHSYVILFLPQTYSLEVKYEWYAHDLQGMRNGDIVNIIHQAIPFIVKKIEQSEIIYLSSIDDLKIEDAFYKQILISQNIQSQIILPIISGDRQIVFLGLETIRAKKSWSDESITLLKMITEIFAHTVERQRFKQTLNINQERYHRAIQAGKVGIWEWNIETNEIYLGPNLKSMLGYAESELSNDFDEWLNRIHPDDICTYKVEINAYLEGLIPKYQMEHRMRTKDGNYIWFLAQGTVLRDENGKPQCIAGSNIDITVNKQAEIKLKASLQEKEVLLKEIHHRVKNNLQVISSLLRLQAGYIQDELALEIFRDSQNRVRAMAMIHENLYHSQDLASINFANYIHNLTQNLIRCYGVNKNIQIHQNVDKVLLRVDTAIPCGLIINELVSNSIKHAFIEQETGQIYIDFIDVGNGKYSLTISDDGVGFVETIEEKSRKSLGLQLVWSLVEQLEGSIISNTQSGTLFTITFAQLY